MDYMSKALFIAEKPSVAIEFAKALKLKTTKYDGYLEAEQAVITWCVGHLVSMSYPEKYDPSLKKWRLEALPFLPKTYKYEVINGVKKQFNIVKTQLKRSDVKTIYVCTDSGREGEYIYRLVDEMVGVKDKEKKRVWIDSQTEAEIRRGIKEAKPLEAYDALSESAYLRAKEDYLMGINFSRLLTLQYGPMISRFIGNNYTVIAVGRVMTCVLGMVVKREREIRSFVKKPFYKVNASFNYNAIQYEGEWKAVEGSAYYNSPLLDRENGFKKEEDAIRMIDWLKEEPLEAVIDHVERKREKKYAPLFFNLAELQNECSKRFKLSPDETLKVAQELYEKKLVTYPRTDARVLSTAVAKEIHKNIKGLTQFTPLSQEAEKVIQEGMYKGLSKTKYVNDKAITDHYAIIPTGEGLAGLPRLSGQAKSVYEMICRRFIAVFYPPAIYQKLSIVTGIKGEKFFTSFKVCIDKGYLVVLKDNDENETVDLELYKQLKKGTTLKVDTIEVKVGETTPPKRYNSGNIILAMENAGQLIEDEDLREQIKGSGIGTSATRSEILKKLIAIKYIGLNKKTQIITPTGLGEMIYDVVELSINSLLNPELTASWEKGLGLVASGEIGSEAYMEKLERYIISKTQRVKQVKDEQKIMARFHQIPENLIVKAKKKTNKVPSTKKKKGICRCFACETGEILENTKAFYCNHWQEGCEFTIWKNALQMYGQQVTKEIIQKLSKDKVIKGLEIILPQTREKGVADLELRQDNSGHFELKNFKRDKVKV